MVIEDALATMRIRFFKHDLEHAVRHFHGLHQVNLAADNRSDSLFLDYLSSTFTLESSSDTVLPSIVGSGEESDVWWYDLQFKHEGPFDDVSMTNQLLFDIFDDQKNIITTTQLPAGLRRVLYFVRGASKHSFTIEVQ
jgi:hypothetical protein